MNTILPRWWKPVRDESGNIAARCGLCFHRCLIKQDSGGRCGARRFSGGAFESPFLGKFVSVAVDPIEKKPLYHWRPGTKILSLGGLRCNLFCPFCQNHAIAHPKGEIAARDIPPRDLTQTATGLGLDSVAYTYNEPTLQAEYIMASAPLLREAGIATVMVTNGLFSGEARDELAPLVDAMNIDVKTFGGDYARLGADPELARSALETVMENVESLFRAGVHIELTNLIVPGISDSEASFAEMISWIAGISREIPLHISRYFPAYKYDAPPTDIHLMKKLESAARKKLEFVHLGNV
jgi:pyruvate formate lyase activating enzyme